MISFAQNQEDVLLARALSDTDCGFYVDVGAGDPTEHSVTRHFYDLGWHGINVEPQPTYADRLRQARPRDVTLEVALSDHTPAGTSVSSESAVQLSTLAEVCSEPCADGDDISFLKMDVDGHKAAAVAGADWMRWMPRVAGDRGHRALERSSDSRAL